ncbi:unnamed protein product [Auanema sp. JU1783]|nr:unnamed protein product [Auanema sp. JU1783]
MWKSMFFKILFLAFLLQLTTTNALPADNRAFETIDWSDYRKRSDSATHESLVNMLHPLRKMPNQKWIDLGWSWGGK